MAATPTGAFIRKFSSRSWPGWLPALLVLLGVAVYLVQALWYAHTSKTSLDEGAYLYKGYLFVSGTYRPFEPYGPLTNKAPLAFMIPGLVQFLFGPGLREGRYFSIFWGLLTILGTSLTARRLAGKWWAVFCVWLFALSPALIKVHSIAVSEVIIAGMLAWILFLVLGDGRPKWQLLLASALAPLVVLTRQNMVFFLPFLYLTILWKHGWKTGLQAIAVGAAVFIAGHALYWPRIMSMWAPWLPSSLTPFLDVYRGTVRAIPAWDPNLDLTNRVTAFFQGVRHHFPILVGAAVSLLLWLFTPRSERRHSAEVVFLGLLYLVLVLVHAWAAVASHYDTYSCVYCFSPYLGFFDPVGVLLMVVCFSGLPAWQSSPGPRRLQAAIAVLFVLSVSVGAGLSMFGDVGGSLLNFPVPRMKAGRFLPGFTTFSETVVNKFGWPLALLRKYMAAALGLLAALLVLLLIYLVWRRYRQALGGYGRTLLAGFLALGILVTPLMAGTESRPDCQLNVIAQNERLGAYLSDTIPPGSLVYWDGGLSVIPLLYAGDIRIFPPQLNDGYSFRLGGDSDELYRLGLWNEELRQSWIASADIFIIEEWRYKDWQDPLSALGLVEFSPSPVDASCEKDSGLRVFGRSP